MHRLAAGSRCPATVFPSAAAPPTRLDRFGALLSATCAIHCLLVPLLAGVLPAIGLGFVASASIETALVVVAITAGVASALWGFRRHRALRVVTTFAGALAIFLLGRAIGEHHTAGRLLTIGGGLALAAAHLLSARACRRCESACDAG